MAAPTEVGRVALVEVGRPNATLVAEDVEAVIRGLKARLAGEISVSGPDLARSLTELGLIDEYRLYFHAVVLGRGKPFFAGPRPPLRLVASEQIGGDVIRFDLRSCLITDHADQARFEVESCRYRCCRANPKFRIKIGGADYRGNFCCKSRSQKSEFCDRIFATESTSHLGLAGCGRKPPFSLQCKFRHVVCECARALVRTAGHLPEAGEQLAAEADVRWPTGRVRCGRAASSSAGTNTSSVPASASSRIMSPSCSWPIGAALQRFRRHMDRRRHLAGGARHAPVGDQRHLVPAILQDAEHGGQLVQFRHAVGLRALEADDGDEVAVKCRP